MKAKLTALVLVLALLLSGCASLLQRSYTSAADHVDYSAEDDSSVLRAESYRGLVDAMLYFVNEHLTRGVVRLYNYTSNVEADLAAACREITAEDPLSAYAVKNITYEYSRIVSYYEVTVSIEFAHTSAEIAAIRSVSGTSSLRPLLDEVMDTFASSLTLRVSYFSGSEESLRAMAAQAYYDSPFSAFGMPELTVDIYPDSGSQRIVELSFSWPLEKTTLELRSSELRSAALQLMSDHPPLFEEYTATELADLLRSVTLPADPAGADDPYSALTGLPATQRAGVLALEALCQLCGLETTLVSGVYTGSDHAWLIVRAGEEYRHLYLPAAPEEPSLLLTDGEMTSLGHLWMTDRYPACEGEPTALPAAGGGEVPSPSPEGQN